MADDTGPERRAFRVWLTQAVLAGQTDEQLVGQCSELPEALVRGELRSIRESAVLEGALASLGPLARSGLLRRAVLRDGPGVLPQVLPESLPSLVGTQTPCRILGLTADVSVGWETLRGLPIGEVEVCSASSGAELTTLELRWNGFLDRVLAGEPLYLVARNRASQQAVSAFWDAVGTLGGVIDASGGRDLWVGAAGTRTALHHDTGTTIVAPFAGTKRVRLVPPCEEVPSSRPYWADALDLEAFEGRVYTIDLAAPDALSIPAGWWHAVDNLTPVISGSFARIRGFTNRFGWYRANPTAG